MDIFGAEKKRRSNSCLVEHCVMACICDLDVRFFCKKKKKKKDKFLIIVYNLDRRGFSIENY